MPANRLAQRVSSIFERFQDWLKNLEPQPDPSWGVSARYWANPTWSLICLGVFILTALHPPEGLPFRLCYFYHFFGVDCPGCGMTRGLSNIWHGRLGTAIGYHWFAPVTYLYLLAQSSFLFIGRRARTSVVEILNRHDRLFRKAWIWGIAAFLVYGVVRSIGEMLIKLQT